MMMIYKEIYDTLTALEKNLQILSNPLYNDAGGSTICGHVYDHIVEAKKEMEEMLQ